MHVAFVDWVPGLCSLLGMLVINVIDKDRVRGEDVGYGDAGAVWRARAVLFVGFALMAGGLAGSVVRCCFFLIHSPIHFHFYLHLLFLFLCGLTGVCCFCFWWCGGWWAL